MGKQVKQVGDVFTAEFNGVEVTFQASACYLSGKMVKIPITNTDERKEGILVPKTVSFHELHFFLGNGEIVKKTIEKSLGLRTNGAKKHKNCHRRPIAVH